MVDCDYVRCIESERIGTCGHLKNMTLQKKTNFIFEIRAPNLAKITILLLS